MTKFESPCKTETISEADDRTVIEISDKNGSYILTAYQVFPGIQLIYNDAHIQNVHFEERKTMPDNIFEISHCNEGRLEFNINGEFHYLSPGDLAIARTNRVSSSSYFPLRHYHGITIRIDLDKTPKCLSCLLDDVTVKPEKIADKFCGENGGFISRANSSFEHIFSELYSVPQVIKKGYFKIKTLELLLFLSAWDIAKDNFRDRTFTKAQVDLVKEISRYMTEHMNDRITLKQLSERFHISATHIKNTFKGVYGVSIGSYIRTQKMESASYMLEYSDKSILEIAGDHGYDNGSKFASAFRAIKGISPNEYRNLNSIKKEK